MKFREYKPRFETVILYATDARRTYKKLLGVGTKSQLSKFFEADVIVCQDDVKLQTATVLVADDKKFKGKIMKRNSF